MKYIFLITPLLLPVFTCAQDLIILKNGVDTIKCKIIEDNVSFLTYKKYKSVDTSLYQISQDLYDYYTFEKSTSSSRSGITKKNKGAYLNVKEFVDNEPSVIFDFYAKRRSNFNISMFGGSTYKIISLDKKISKSKLKHEFWCVCDGKDCYFNTHSISNKKYYCYLTFDNESAFFYSLPIKQVDINKAKINSSIIIGAGILGGMIGGAIAGASLSGQEVNNKQLYRIDLKTGLVEKYNNNNNPTQ